MLESFSTRGASPPGTPYRGVAPGPHKGGLGGPQTPGPIRAHGNFCWWAKGPSTEISNNIPAFEPWRISNTVGMCHQQRLRPACAYTQSDQSLCLTLEYSMSVKLLTEHHLEFLSLKRDCTGSSEPTFVKMPRCWKSHAVAHLMLFCCIIN